MEKLRDHSIDIAKLICLFLMTYCHIPVAGGYFHECVCSFHMPLFFFVGGLFYNPEKYTIFKGMTTLIIPFIIVNVIVVLLKNVIAILTVGTLNVNNIFTDILGIFLGSSRNFSYSLPSGPTWFLVAFFILKYSASVILPIKNIIIRSLFIVFPIVIAIVLRTVSNWSLWSWDSAALGSVFFYGAYYGRNKILSYMNSIQFRRFLPLLLLFVCLSYLNGQVDIFDMEYGNFFLLYIVFGFIGIGAVIGMGQLFCFLPVSVVQKYTQGAIFIIGFNIFLSDYILLIYRKFVLHDLFFDISCYEKFGITVLIFVLSYPCICFLLRYCPFVLGRKNKYERISYISN